MCLCSCESIFGECCLLCLLVVCLFCVAWPCGVVIFVLVLCVFILCVGLFEVLADGVICDLLNCLCSLYECFYDFLPVCFDDIL